MQLQALPALSDNYIWVLRDDAGGAVVVDPGQAGPVVDAATSGGFRPTAVLLTHHHPDHIGGAAELQARWPGLPVFAPCDDRIACDPTRVGDGERITAGGYAFDVIAVPGHTTSHVAFHLDAGRESLLFCGDTLFSLGCGRLFEGSAAQMHGSLSRLAALPDATRVCCGHEYTLSNAAFARVVEPDNPALRRRTEEAQAMRQAQRPTLPSTIAQERACNPFLRCDQPAVIAAVEQRLGRGPDGPVEVFAELRRWKDGFSA
ncbi:hydroxyacylglutathione hydrolase [Lysobacter sp. F6437]|uniref:hydroxyacylglutathione hydrolase n=1 Tax=Lysobacter sp. F6437 TaxID=3459296 RepID=UPI00403DBE4C